MHAVDTHLRFDVSSSSSSTCFFRLLRCLGLPLAVRVVVAVVEASLPSPASRDLAWLGLRSAESEAMFGTAPESMSPNVGSPSFSRCVPFPHSVARVRGDARERQVTGGTYKLSSATSLAFIIKCYLPLRRRCGLGFGEVDVAMEEARFLPSMVGEPIVKVLQEMDIILLTKYELLLFRLDYRVDLRVWAGLPGLSSKRQDLLPNHTCKWPFIGG